MPTVRGAADGSFPPSPDARAPGRRAPPPEHPNRINFTWLVKLRWSTVTGQLVTIAAVRFAMKLPIPLAPLLGLVGVSLLANVACVWAARRREPEEWWSAVVMALDVVVFTALLYFTGGPLNPFSFLYLVPIALAAITLRGAWTWALVLLSLGGSAVLFVGHAPLPMAGDHARHMSLHLYGMWVAFGVAAAFIVYFLLRVRRALAARDAELELSRGLAARQERLASLATLAAGAAHELATPLSTIAVVAKDLELALAGAGERTVHDVRLVRSQVERCREILARMRADAGDAEGEGFVPTAIADLLQPLVPAAGTEAAGARRAAVRIEIDPALADQRLTVPARALGRALRVLVENGQQASPPGADVAVRAVPDGGFVRFEVRDRDAGIAPDVLARVGEPFFTTKAAGRGMGLGIFLARTVAERLGGGVTLESSPGAGTTAVLFVPAAAAAVSAPAGTGGATGVAGAGGVAGAAATAGAAGSMAAAPALRGHVA